jgi:hypothetical protein
MPLEKWRSFCARAVPSLAAGGRKFIAVTCRPGAHSVVPLLVRPVQMHSVCQRVCRQNHGWSGSFEQMETAVPSWPVKHNWRYIARETPPKRAASERVCDFDEIYGLFDEATARAQDSRCINCPDPQCVKNGCPLANRIPEWLALTAEGRFLEAAALSQSTSNMPEICSRICPQDRLCENACILNARSEPVSIGAVEKFINEYAFAHEELDVAVLRRTVQDRCGRQRSGGWLARMNWQNSVTPSRF